MVGVIKKRTDLVVQIRIASKAAAEISIKSYIDSFFPINGNIKISIGRAGNVIGGGD